MTDKRIYFRETTPQQRIYLFRMWEETQNVQEACRRAKVSRGTFYHWKERFEEGGYAALQESLSHAPKKPYRIEGKIACTVVYLKRQHPKWGKRRIAQELETIEEVSISPNTVRRILQDADLW